jgi:hypothetical protein
MYYNIGGFTMKKKVLCMTLALSLSLGTGITALAAPQAVEGGGVFDADYYADNNPDVEAAVGRDFNLLWEHYITYGANEGRLPFAEGTDWEAVLAASTVEGQVDETPEQVDSVAYPINVIQDLGDGRFNNNSTVVTFYDDANTTIGKDIDGYKWQAFKINMGGLGAGFVEDQVGRWNMHIGAEGSSNWDHAKWDEVSQFFNTPDSYDEKGRPIYYLSTDGTDATAEYDYFLAWKFNIEIDGNTYIGIVAELDEPSDYIHYYYLTPEIYTGQTYFTTVGTVVENGEIVGNENDEHTYILK